MNKKMASDDAPLRADAARNRARILEAAEAVFVERGADASLEEVAKRANVGIGTLYRRFPTREDLLAAVSDERLLAIADASRQRDELGPVASVRLFVSELVAHTTHYRGLAATLGAVLRSETPGCHASTGEGNRLLLWAQETGVMRQDVTIGDLVCVITAISLAVEQDASAKARIAHRVDLFLEGFGAR